MLPLNLLSRLPTKCPVTQIVRGVSTSGMMSKQCGPGKPRKSKEEYCREQCASMKKKSSKKCDSLESHKKERHEEVEELPEYCSKQVAMECARKIKELQEQWETIAAQVPDKHRGDKRPSPCGVRPPKKDEDEGGSNLLIYLGVGAVLAALAYWLYSKSQQVEGNDGKYDNDDDDDQVHDAKKEK